MGPRVIVRLEIVIMRKFISILLVLLVPLCCFAQYKINTQPQDISTKLRTQNGMGQGLVGIFGLDPSRASMQHSYQMGYSSFGGNNFSQGMYLNTLTYDFSIPLSMSVQWGIANQFLPGLNASPMMNDGPFISGAQILYKPTKNTVIHLEYRKMPNGYGSRYGSPYRMGRYRNRNSFFEEW
jgi:hypothetical protein